MYFKSTDGHTSQWDFSTRRLNLHIFDLIQAENGIVIVDSTRRGKRMPDALSKTVPVWCAIINMALFGNKDQKLYLPPHVISPSERSQIEQRIPRFVEKFKEAGVDVDTLIRSKIKKPLRPIWVTPDAFDGPSVKEVDWKTLTEFHPIVLCTASVMAQDNTDFRPGYTYVQGAADDHEEWAALLTPDLLWDNMNLLGDIEVSDDQIQIEIERLHTESKSKATEKEGSIKDCISHIAPSCYSIAKASDIASCKDYTKQIEQDFDVLICLSTMQLTSKSVQVISQPLPDGKKGSKELRTVLPKIMDQYGATHTGKRTLIVCDTGSDLSVGMCLALLCLYPPEGTARARDKVTIRQRLVTITSHCKVNPSRATLNSVNSFLMS